MTTQRRRAYAALILTAIIWGAALPIIKPALEHISPPQYLLYRYLIASAVSIPFFIWLVRKHRPSLKTLGVITLMELVIIGIGHFLLYAGLARTSALEASLIGSTSPIFITLGGVYFLKEKQERHEWFGLGIALVGTLLIIFEPLLSAQKGQSLQGLSFTGNLMVLGYVVIATGYMLIAKKVYRHISKLLIGSISPFLGLLIFLPIVWFSHPQPSNFLVPLLTIPSVMFAAVYMGFLGTLIAGTAVIYGNNQIEASEASLFSYLQPLVYIPLTVLWLGDYPTPPIILGLILIAIGVFSAEYRPRRALAKRN